MTDSEFDLDLDELSSAEDFLDYFKIEYEQKIVHVNRLHILQRFHDYLNTVREMPEDDQSRREIYTQMLQKAYQDFKLSDAQTEKVFKVFQMANPSEVSIPMHKINIEKNPSASQV